MAKDRLKGNNLLTELLATKEQSTVLSREGYTALELQELITYWTYKLNKLTETSNLLVFNPRQRIVRHLDLLKTKLLNQVKLEVEQAYHPLNTSQITLDQLYTLKQDFEQVANFVVDLRLDVSKQSNDDFGYALRQLLQSLHQLTDQASEIIKIRTTIGQDQTTYQVVP